MSATIGMAPPSVGWGLLAERLLRALDGSQPVAATAHVPRSAALIRRREAAVDRDALIASMFESEGAALVRLARLFTEDRNAAEDLVQEAFVRLHHAAHRIQDQSKAAAYLRSIVLNLCRDHNRRGLMSLRHLEALTPEVSSEAPEDRIVLDDRKMRVIEALHALSPQQRGCLVLRYYLELSERETGETLGISSNSVKTHCRRGLDRLRLLLEDER